MAPPAGPPLVDVDYSLHGDVWRCHHCLHHEPSVREPEGENLMRQHIRDVHPRDLRW